MQGRLNCCSASHQSPGVVQTVWQVLCHGSQPCADVLCAWNAWVPLFRHCNCKNVNDSHALSPMSKRTDKEQETCRLVSQLTLCISKLLQWCHEAQREMDASGMSMWKTVPAAVHSQEQVLTSAQCPSEEGEGHTVPAVAWAMPACYALRGIPEKQVNTTKKCNPDTLFICQGVREDAAVVFKLKCFNTPLLSGEFIVFIHHYWLGTCPDIYCVCFRKLRFSVFPKFLTFKTIWSPMGHLDLQRCWAVTSIPPQHFL